MPRVGVTAMRLAHRCQRRPGRHRTLLLRIFKQRISPLPRRALARCGEGRPGRHRSYEFSNSQFPPMSSPDLIGRPSIPEAPAIEPRSRGVPGPPLSRATTTEQDSTISPRHAPEFLQEFLRASHKRAQGMPDARCTRSLACKIKQSIRAYSPQVHRKHTGIPCAMVLTAPPWSPWCTGLVSHPRLRELRPAN
jgi:hypothetical protein